MRFLLSLIFLSLVLAAPAEAQKPPTAKEIGDIVFKEVERRAIEEFFGNKAEKAKAKDDDSGKSKGKGRGKGKGKGRGKGLPPGLAKRDSLPPGLQRQLEKNGTLPPGLAKRDLPAGLKSQLPEPPPGLERIIAGDSVVLLEKATGKILDVIQGVLKGK